MRKQWTIAALIVVAGLVGPLGAAASAIAAAASTASSRVAPPQRTPLDDVLLASIDLPNLSWLAAYGGYVWVKRDDGFVERINPHTNASTGRLGRFTGRDDYCQGIGAGGGAIWSCSRSSITRIDPKRLKIVKTIPVGKVFDQGRLLFAAGRLWVITGANADELVGIDPATNRPSRPIKLPVACTDLALGAGNAVWVLCPLANKVVKVDPARRRIAGVVALPEPEAGFATARDLWVGSSRGLVRIDARTLKQVARFPGLDPGAEGDVTVDGDRVWVRVTSGFLYRIDAKRNTLAEQVRGDATLGGGSLLVAAGSLWTTADDASKLLRLRRNA